MEVTCLALFLVSLRYSIETLLMHHQLYKLHSSQSEESYLLAAERSTENMIPRSRVSEIRSSFSIGSIK